MDVLKQTLHWSSNPTFTIDDLGATGGTEQRAITAAEAHDASDTTYEGIAVQGDGGGNSGDLLAYTDHAIQTASVSGPISFVRVVMRARVTGTNAQGTVQARIGGASQGSAANLTASYVGYSFDFPLDPGTSDDWTNALINGQSWGAELHAQESDADFPAAATLRMTEWEVQVWGPDVQTMSPAAAGVVVGVGAATLVANLVALSCSPAGISVSPTDPTLAPGVIALQPEAAVVDSFGDGEVWTNGARNPLAPVDVDVYVDAGTTPIRIVRSDTAPFDDNNDATKTLTSSPASWPNSGTITFNFHGTEGSTSLDGEGPIAGVKLYTRVRARKDTNAVLSNFRLEFAGVVIPLLTQPTVYPMLPAAAFYETLASDLVPLTSNAVPFEWGQGVNSVFTQAASGWVLKADYSVGGAFSGQFAQVECSEAWLEIYGFNGSTPELVEVKHKMGNLRRVQQVEPIVEEE